MRGPNFGPSDPCKRCPPGATGPTGSAGTTGPTGPTGVGIPAPPVQSVQFDAGGSPAVFGGSSDVAISADADQVLVTGLDNVGPIPSTGNMRYVAGPLDGNGYIARVRSGRTNPGDERDVGFYYTYSTTAGNFGGEEVIIGRGDWGLNFVFDPTLCPNEIIDTFQNGLAQIFTTPTPDGNQNGTFLVELPRSADPVGGFAFARFLLVQRYTNLILFPVDFAPIEDALGRGEGVIVRGHAIVTPTTNPTSGQIIEYVSSADTDDRPYYRNAAGEVVPEYARSSEGVATTDQGTNSVTFVDLVTATLSTQSGVIDVVASATVQASGGNVFFILTIDGTPIHFMGAVVLGSAILGNIALNKRFSGLSPGSHTIALQWRVDAGSASIAVSSSPDEFHASILASVSS